jgi:AraC-like DNA-binding protein
MDLVIHLNGTASAQAAVSGAHSKATILSTVKPLDIIAARFKPGGGYPFFGVPAGVLQDLSVPLDALWGAEAATLHERLLAAPTPREKFLVLESALLEKLRGGSAPTPAVRHAIDTFQDSPRLISVAEVVARTGLSARRLIASFKDEVGLTPKTYSRICRFRGLIRRIHQATAVDWADTALACGYFDQAHFVHDFRAIVGVTPSDYLRNRTEHLNHVRMAD